MTFFSDALVDDQFVAAIRRDLDRADVCRFLVAYISESGVDQIGRGRLCRALDNAHSFGVGSISCACGYEPLMELQKHLPLDPPRLKYFMDPALRKSDEPDDIALLHSKVVYLRVMIDGEPKSVVYVGSHNWSRRALGGGGPKNAEASYRFELPFQESHLLGVGDDLAAQVNRHLLAAFNNACCLEAIEANRQTFEEWTNAACKNRPPSSLDEVLLILAVRSRSSNHGFPLVNLRDQGIYLQCLEEPEGAAVWKAPDQALVLVWDTPDDLRAGEQPTILICSKGTRNPGPTSARRGTNQADDPIRGFAAVLFDEQQLEHAENERSTERTWLQTRKQSQVQVFDFEYPATHSDCKDYDRTVSPKYQYLLDVTEVVEPQGRTSACPEYVWDRSTFAVAHDRSDARYEKVEGYVVPDDVFDGMASTLERQFGVRLSDTTAKALPNPASKVRRLKIGKRFATSSVHETFIPEFIEQSPDVLYAKVSNELLGANLDPRPEEYGSSQLELFTINVPLIERSQRVFTTKLEKLKEVWKQAAKTLRGELDRKPDLDRP